MALKQRGIEIHGLGIQLQGDETEGITKEEVERRMRKMVSTGEAARHIMNLPMSLQILLII